MNKIVEKIREINMISKIVFIVGMVLILTSVYILARPEKLSEDEVREILGKVDEDFKIDVQRLVWYKYIEKPAKDEIVIISKEEYEDVLKKNTSDKSVFDEAKKLGYKCKGYVKLYMEDGYVDPSGESYIYCKGDYIYETLGFKKIQRQANVK